MDFQNTLAGGAAVASYVYLYPMVAEKVPGGALAAGAIGVGGVIVGAKFLDGYARAAVVGASAGLITGAAFSYIKG